MSSDTETKMPPHFALQEVVQRTGLSEHTLRYNDLFDDRVESLLGMVQNHARGE